MKINLLTVILILLSPILGFSQQGVITGKIVDENTNEPLLGVNIFIKNTERGTMSDFDGNYKIEAAPNEVLVFSYVGYAALEVTVGLESNIDVALAVDAFALDDVIVTGYQTERKKDVTGAVTVVDVDEMKKQAVANPIKALQGRVAGMYVTGNGSPSSPSTVRIRGIGTLNNNDPLYIIDGVPTKAGMHEMNSQDIESIQVLKDASAASIYGSRAANGVIIVTTKKGQLGKVKLNVNAYSSISQYAGRTEMLDTEGYGRALWQANINNGTDPNNNSAQYRFDWGVNPETGMAVLNQVLVPEFLDAEQTMRASDTDWFDEISQLGLIQNYDLSLSNGTETGSYYLSLGYFNSEGVIKTSEFDRISARLNSDYKFFDGRVVIGENLSLTKTSEVAAAPMNAAMQALPIIPVRTVDGVGWGGPVGGMNDRQNPVRLLEDNKQNGYDFFRLFGSFYAEATIFDGLKFRTNFGVDYGNYTYRNLRKRYQSGYLNNPVNKVESGQTHNLKTTWTNTVNYTLEAGNHSLNALAGTEFYREKNNNFWASREDFVVEDDDFTYLDAGTGQKDNGGSGAEHVLLSYFGRVNYSLLDRYLVSGTLRYDGSSRFGQNNRFGTFPALSVGWRLSEETFIANNTQIFDELKLRFGWGVTGNQEIDNNAIYNLYLTDYNSTSYDINGNGSGVLPSGYKLVQNANPNLRWEESTMTNFGLDFEMFNHKLYGSAEYYIRETSDILLLPPYIGTLGEGGNQWVNGASMENKGFELSLGNRTEFSENLRMKLDANFSLYRNKVTVLPSEVVNAYGGDGRGQNILGRPINSYFGFVADGLFQTENDVAVHAEQPGKGLGRIKYADLNSDGVINDFDRTWIGTPHPDFTYGLSAEFNYKQFDLSLFLQGIAGVDVINDFKFATDFWSASETGSNKGARLLNAWSPTNTDSDIPSISLVDANWEARFSTYFIENGSYLKLRNVQLGYTFTDTISSKMGIDYLRFYLGGDNLAILLKSKSFTGIDPENPGYGYPNPIVLTGGFNIRF